jgi:type I restriction enzyme R subunit
MTEADTCRKFVVPLLQKAGWDNDPHSIAEQRYFTAGRIVAHGQSARRRPGKRADYLLRYTRDLPLAVVEATRNFADSAFDGEPAFATQEKIDEHGNVKETEVITPEEPETADDVGNDTLSSSIEERAGVRSRKYYYDGGQVEIAAELVHELDADGKQLRVIKLTDYTAEKVRTLCTGLEDLRARWADATERAAIIEQLAERGVDFQTVAAQAGKPDADPFDLLCHLAFNAPVLTRRQRADRVKKHQAAFFAYYAPEAREILSHLLEKYVADGELQFTLPDVLKVPPLSSRGNVNEIMGRFGGADNLRNAVNQLQSLLYAA